MADRWFDSDSKTWRTGQRPSPGSGGSGSGDQPKPKDPTDDRPRRENYPNTLTGGNDWDKDLSEWEKDPAAFRAKKKPAQQAEALRKSVE